MQIENYSDIRDQLGVIAEHIQVLSRLELLIETGKVNIKGTTLKANAELINSAKAKKELVKAELDVILRAVLEL